MLPEWKELWRGRLVTINAIRHKITLEDEIRSLDKKSYRIRQKALVVLREHIDIELEACVVKPAQIDLASSIVLISKTDDTIRFYVAYRHQNAATIPKIYLLQRMNICIHSF